MKSSNKLLLFSFLVLTVLAFFYIWRSSSPSRTFKEHLATIDTAKVSKIIIDRPKTDNSGGTTLLERTPTNTWQVAEGDSLRGTVEGQVMQSILQAVADLQKPKQMVSNSPEKQTEYKVSQAAGALRLRVFETGDKAVMDIHLGKLAIQQKGGNNPNNPQQNDPQAMMSGRQQQPIINTYVRLEGENDIYAIEGMPAMMLNRPAKDFLPQQPVEPAPDK